MYIDGKTHRRVWASWLGARRSGPEEGDLAKHGLLLSNYGHFTAGDTRLPLKYFT